MLYEVITVIASALIEFDGYAETDYLTSAKEILKSLSGDVYYAIQYLPD